MTTSTSSGDQVRFAPVYDIASALPYGIHEKELRLSMKIGGDYRIFPEHNTWPGAASELGIDPDALVYYRNAWAVQDIAADGEQVFFRPELGDASRQHAVRMFKLLFEPGNIVSIAEGTG